jgi:hypothetical protein
MHGCFSRLCLRCVSERVCVCVRECVYAMEYTGSVAGAAGAARDSRAAAAAAASVDSRCPGGFVLTPEQLEAADRADRAAKADKARAARGGRR